MNASTERDWLCSRTGERYSVDAGLEDAWLEELNSFDHLYLRSICEGHPNGSTWASKKSMPVLRLSVARPSVPVVTASAGTIDTQIRSLFASGPLSFSSTIEHGWSSFDASDYFIHLDARRHRASPEMEPWVREWFSQAIAFLRDVDAFIRDLALRSPEKT